MAMHEEEKGGERKRLGEQNSECYTFGRWITGRVKRNVIQSEKVEGVEEAFDFGVFLQALRPWPRHTLARWRKN